MIRLDLMKDNKLALANIVNLSLENPYSLLTGAKRLKKSMNKILNRKKRINQRESSSIFSASSYWEK